MTLADVLTGLGLWVAGTFALFGLYAAVVYARDAFYRWRWRHWAGTDHDWDAEMRRILPALYDDEDRP